ncbi:fumarylacetoacetate hydrolase family protein [Pochonia chlamydosporia 170]|uniref:Fumarylacetoacetate hydrolase family protein n=1 Tax=Pochonia chlamydosporia 170 TaxID=1380566 RepID=A0A179G1R8_METCM|nr:fumarylacetoacetate hydrolase family protein [Pochonia chlamydosporia 170]OAQ71428.1 fumarylacetoacetate hydrolase family protein [Pochonia chlamydosporia 170]
MAFKRLVRVSEGGQTFYGDLISSNGSNYTVKKLLGTSFEALRETETVVQTNKLLCPIERSPLVICIGLNYRTHAEEAKLAIPKYPAVFTKPADALAGPFDTVYTHPDTRELLDYEGELVIVIGKDAKNVSEADALDYVLGFTAGNDVSARNFQLPEVSGGQFCYAKSFDGFAPIGHTLTAPSELSNPLAVRLTTKVNGVIKQDSNTNDLIFNVGQIISHLSRGTTLRKGTVIMTGTPAGVGYFRKEFLKDGDVVEVEIEGVGMVRNTISFSEG